MRVPARQERTWAQKQTDRRACADAMRSVHARRSCGAWSSAVWGFSGRLWRKSGQLAAAAGAEDVLDDDEVLEEELLVEDPEVSELLDFDSVFALSLAVLPLRESVR